MKNVLDFFEAQKRRLGERLNAHPEMFSASETEKLVANFSIAMPPKAVSSIASPSPQGVSVSAWPKRVISGFFPLPQSNESVVMWLRETGHETILDQPLSTLIPRIPTMATRELSKVGGELSIGAYLNKRTHSSYGDPLRQAVEKIAVEMGIRASRIALVHQRAAALEQHGCPTPEAARFASSLLTLISHLTEHHLQLERFVLRRPMLHLEPGDRVLQILFDSEYGYGSTVRVGLWPDRPEEMLASCSCTGRYEAPCSSLIVALGWVLEVLYDRNEPAHLAVVEAVSRRASAASVAAVVTSVLGRRETSQEKNARVVWRIQEQDGVMLVSAAVQKRGKKGKWTAGSQAAIGRLRRDSATCSLLDSADNAVIDAFAKSRDHYQLDVKAPVKAGDAIAALVGHPQVWSVGKEPRPVAVIREPATLGLVPEDDEYRLCLRFAGESWSVGRVARSRGDSHTLVRYDESRGVCQVGELSGLTIDLIDGLANAPSRLRREDAVGLLDAVGRTGVCVELETPDELRGASIPGDPRCHVLLTPHDDQLLLGIALVARPTGDQLAVKPGAGQSEIVRGVGGVLTAVRRDLPAEAHHAESLAQTLGLAELISHEPWSWQTASIEESLRVVEALGQLGDDVRVEWPKDSDRWFVHRAGRNELKVNVHKKGEWFAVSPVVSTDGRTIPLELLIEAARAKRRFIKLGPQRFAVLEEHLRAAVLAMDDLAAEGTTKELRLDALSVSLLNDAIQGHGLTMEGDRAFNQLLGNRAELDRYEPELPASLRVDLREYQRQGFAWLARLCQMGGGACLADDMGLGKTVQALALLLCRETLGPALVVAPTSVLSTWLGQAKSFAPKLDVRLYHGTGRDAIRANLGPGSVLVTSYDVLAMDVEELATISFGTFILDEAQNVKNAATLRARAARRIDAQARVALSGTPIENHLGELWSIFHIIAPGLLGSFERFRTRFAAPIEKGSDPERREALARLLRPFVLRRTKAVVAPELPPRIEVVRTVELSEAEKTRYEAVRQAMVRQLLDVEARDPKDRFQVLAAITRLRRLACHPRLDDPATTLGSAKLEAVRELLSDLAAEGQRALVFSQFTSHLALLRETLDKGKRPYLYLDGSTDAKVRARLVDEWSTGEPSLFLISLKAGGTGLNLTGADYVLHLDPWWNPAVEDQATDRTHRIGQTKTVTVVRFISAGTIEETVVALHARKRELAAALLEGTETAGRLSTAELMEIIGNARAQ
ncbi:MAG: DEAD/DEAH box helicase [Myxococcota bacterium]|nr:DEAD/DEAH box helicase [Myxococcota bacterium]